MDWTVTATSVGSLVGFATGAFCFSWSAGRKYERVTGTIKEVADHVAELRRDYEEHKMSEERRNGESTKLLMDIKDSVTSLNGDIMTLYATVNTRLPELSKISDIAVKVARIEGILEGERK